MIEQVVGTTGVNHVSVLDDLIQRRNNLVEQISVIDAAIKGLEAVYGRVEVAAAPTGALSLMQRAQLRQSATVAEAAERFLEQAGRPQKTEEIANALQSIGLLSATKNPGNVVFSSMSRKSEFVRVSRGVWALTKWNLVADVGLSDVA